MKRWLKLLAIDWLCRIHNQLGIWRYDVNRLLERLDPTTPVVELMKGDPDKNPAQFSGSVLQGFYYYTDRNGEVVKHPIEFTVTKGP